MSMGQCRIDGRDGDQNDGQDHFRQYVAEIVKRGSPYGSRIVGKRACRIGGVENQTGNLMEQKASGYPHDIAL